MSTQPALSTDAPALLPPPTLRELLMAKYSLPHHVLLWEVRNSTGFNSNRSADAIAVTLYVSHGHCITGFEIKESRSDWLAELKRPEKAEAIARFCDYFYLVTSTPTIAKLDELPMPWGWFAGGGARLRVMKKAERLRPEPLDRPMLCSLVYSTMKRFDGEAERRIETTVAEQVEAKHHWLKVDLEQSRRELDDLRETVQEFEKASGVFLRHSKEKMHKIGAVVKRVLNEEGVLTGYKSQLQYVLDHAERVASAVRKELSELEPLPASTEFDQ